MKLESPVLARLAEVPDRLRPFIGRAVDDEDVKIDDGDAGVVAATACSHVVRSRGGRHRRRVAVVLALAAVERCGEAPAMIVQSDYGVGAAASRCVGDFFLPWRVPGALPSTTRFFSL